MKLTGTIGIKLNHFDLKTWKLRNSLRPNYILGWLQTAIAKAMSHMFGVLSMTSELHGTFVRKNGERYDLGVMGRRVVTDTGTAFIVDAWQNTVELEIMKYHGVGTGTNAEAVGDTALQTESTTILNPDSTRATGSLTEGSGANIFKTVGTVAFDGAGAITEHGIFSQAATGGGVLFDRTVFTAVNVVSGDSIEFTYQLTIASGG